MPAFAFSQPRRALLCGLVAATAALVLLSSVARPAQEKSSGDISVKAPQAMLMDAELGGVMYQRNGDELMYPASMSKLMTLAVVFKALKAGEIKLSDEFFMSENAWRKGGAPSGTSAMFVPVGKKAKLEELLKGIIVQSGNDAAISIAENMAGNEGVFAKRMNDEARLIGLKKSVFKNATGLPTPAAPDDGARARHAGAPPDPDLSGVLPVLRPEGVQLPQVQVHQSQSAAGAGRGRRRPAAGLHQGCGLRPGRLRQAGEPAADRGGERPLHGRRAPGRGAAPAGMGFPAFAESKLYDAGEVVGHARVWGGTRMYVPLAGKSDVNVWLPRNMANQKLRASIVYQWPLKPPLRKGDQVAVLRVTTSSESMNEVPLFVAEDVDPAGTVRRGLTLLCLATRWLP